MEKKTVKDLEGWTEIVSILSPFGNNYKAYISPNRKKMANVDPKTGEVTIIFHRETHDILYIHPISARGMRRLGLTEEDFKRILR